jgi:hypothetical protein
MSDALKRVNDWKPRPLMQKLGNKICLIKPSLREPTRMKRNRLNDTGWIPARIRTYEFQSLGIDRHTESTKGIGHQFVLNLSDHTLKGIIKVP